MSKPFVHGQYIQMRNTKAVRNWHEQYPTVFPAPYTYGFVLAVDESYCEIRFAEHITWVRQDLLKHIPVHKQAEAKKEVYGE